MYRTLAVIAAVFISSAAFASIAVRAPELDPQGAMTAVMLFGFAALALKRPRG